MQWLLLGCLITLPTPCFNILLGMNSGKLLPLYLSVAPLMLFWLRDVFLCQTFAFSRIGTISRRVLSPAGVWHCLHVWMWMGRGSTLAMTFFFCPFTEEGLRSQGYPPEMHQCSLQRFLFSKLQEDCRNSKGNRKVSRDALIFLTE